MRLLIGVMLLSFAFCSPAQDRPQVQTEGVSKNPPRAEQQTSAQQKTLTPPALAAVDPAPPQAVGKGDNNHRDSEASEFWSVFGWRLKLTDSLLVLFTFCLFLATLALWKSTSDLVHGAEKTAQTQLRAYIGTEPGDISEQNCREETSFEFRPFITNRGATPALGVEYAANCELLPHPLPPGFRPTIDMGPEPSRTTIGAGQHRMMVIGGLYLYPDQLRDAITGANRRIYVFGRIVYTDAFGTRRHTNFCYYVVWGSRGFPALFAANKYNDAS